MPKTITSVRFTYEVAEHQSVFFPSKITNHHDLSIQHEQTEYRFNHYRQQKHPTDVFVFDNTMITSGIADLFKQSF